MNMSIMSEIGCFSAPSSHVHRQIAIAPAPDGEVHVVHTERGCVQQGIATSKWIRLHAATNIKPSQDEVLDLLFTARGLFAGFGSD